jgi:hypothetical protein
MARLVAISVALLVSLSLFAQRVFALVVERSVTPASVREKDSKFSLAAEKRDDGLIHFAITYRLARPEYLVAHFELRDGETTLVKTDTPSFVREATATYHLAVSPKHLADSRFELSENSFAESDGHPVPLPGGTIFQIDLKGFGEDARVAKAEEPGA